MTPTSTPSTATASPALIGLCWLIVGLPLAWGIWQTLLKVVQLFQ